MCVVWWCGGVLQRGHNSDGCELASTLCKHVLRKGDLFVLSWERVQRVRRGNVSLEMLMCCGDVRSMVFLPLVARFLETIDVHPEAGLNNAFCMTCSLLMLVEDEMGDHMEEEYSRSIS